MPVRPESPNLVHLKWGSLACFHTKHLHIFSNCPRTSLACWWRTLATVTVDNYPCGMIVWCWFLSVSSTLRLKRVCLLKPCRPLDCSPSSPSWTNGASLFLLTNAIKAGDLSLINAIHWTDPSFLNIYYFLPHWRENAVSPRAWF